MVFSSVAFLVYFLPAVLLLYLITPRKFRNGLLLVASIFFYSWGAPRFIFVILCTTFLDFWLVGLMARSAGERRRKLLLVLSVSLNLGLLFYFKYFNFFIENINAALESFGSAPLGYLSVVLPIGISFYTFESLTYVVDVYRKVHAPLRKFWNYQLYIIFFPKLIAGPIIKYHDIADQITNRALTDNAENRLNGFYRFVIGLSKKVFIANTMGVYADLVFNAPDGDISAAAAWLGVLCYAFQIYFDFSGYSDMAIGLARMFGFLIPENFNNPYTSGSVTEFWRRWHISLGNWMREYLYIPLGGNRVNARWRVYFNLWVVFLASGLWHGAAWTFVLWGAYHGLFLVLERLFLLRIYERAGRAASVVFTFLVVCFGWILFRADTVPQALQIAGKMFSSDFRLGPLYHDTTFRFYFALAILFSFITLLPAGRKIEKMVFEGPRSVAVLATYTPIALILFVAALANIASSTFNPFIYFRF